MSVYSFEPASPVQAIAFRFAPDRSPVALLTAGAGLAPEQPGIVRAQLEREGFRTVPAAVEGHEVLQVDGFGRPEKLLTFLSRQQFTQGPAHIEAQAGDNPMRSWGEWLQQTSLKSCGWGNVVGDISLLVSGLVAGRGSEALSGLLYTAGGATLARYGNVKTEEHVRGVSERTAKFLEEQAGTLPDSCGLSQVLKEKREGVLPHLEQFLTRYPSQTTVGIYTLGAAAMLRSGIQHKKFWDVAYGINSTAAGAASILIPEKRISAEEKAAAAGHPIQQMWNWFQEKPLRAAGYAYVVSDIALGLSAYREYRANPQQKAYIFKFISAGTYLVSSLLMAISNKDHVNADGKFDADEQRRIEALAAESIAQQPKEMQRPLAHHVAGFLVTQPEMLGTAPEIAARIEEQVAHLKRHPWACPPSGDWQERAQGGMMQAPMR